MREYIFILKKYVDGEILRKALYFKDLEEHLKEGWDFNTPDDKKIYQALYNFYVVMKK